MDDILSWSRAVLATTPRRWISLAGSLPPVLLRRPPAEGELSALACLGHLLDTERYVFPIRVGYFLAGQDFPAFNPEDEGTAVQDDTDPLEWARAFDRLRQESLVLFDRISAADLAKRARHAELGEVTLGEMLHEWAGHDMMHTVQAEQALMQPFIDGCGPWQVYFQAHWVKERGNLGHPQ